MSNFYRNTFDIASSTSSLPSVIYALTNTNVANSFKKNGSNIFTNTNYISPFTNINEKPNTINYQYQGTDISNWSIAAYTEGNNNSSFSQSILPTWCKNVRIIAIGGGGSGFAGQHIHNAEHHATTTNLDIYIHQNNNHDHYQNDQQHGTLNQNQNRQQPGKYDNTAQGPLGNHQANNEQSRAQHNNQGLRQDNNYNTHIHQNNNERQQQTQYGNIDTPHNYDAASYKGAGGAAIYITSIQTQTYNQINITAGGPSSSTHVSLNTTQISVGGAQTTTAGTVQGTMPSQSYAYSGSASNQNPGQNGINNSAQFTTTLTYGNGGETGAGNPGYYRVYFLTD